MPNVCGECGALIPDGFRERHKQWHEVTLSWFEVLTDKVDSLRYHPGPCGSVVFVNRHGTQPCRCQFWDTHIGVHRCQFCNQEWENR